LYVDDSTVGYGTTAQVAEPTTDQRNWFAKHKILTAIGAVLALVIIGNMLGGKDDKDEVVLTQAKATESAEAAPAPTNTEAAAAPAAPAPPPQTSAAAPKPKPAAPASKYGKQPADEIEFLQMVTTAQQASRDADNDLQKGAAKAVRDKGICALLSSKDIAGWTGKLTTVDANGEGKGVLKVEIAEGVHIGTWNNAFSDIGDDTLIEPSSPLFANALTLKEGQLIHFSGSFLDTSDDGECVREGSMTLRGKLQTPTFIFRFSDVGAA
jgi:hypothetical protein